MNTIVSWFAGLWNRRYRGPEADEVKTLTDQFFVTLRACASELPGQDPPDAANRIRELLQQEQSWNRAYEVEQLFTRVADETTIAIELRRRAIEAQSVLHPEVAAWYTKQVNEAADGATKRALLGRLVNDLQWRYTVNEAKRWYSKRITSHTSVSFLLAVFVVFITAVIVLSQSVSSIGNSSGSIGSLSIMALVGFSGAWGATFSMMIGLRARIEASSLDELKLTHATLPFGARPLIGVGAALILYFFLISGLLGGEAFPKLENAVPATTKDLAMLLVWTFIAGFSERLVPSLLARTEGQATRERTPEVPGSRPEPPRNEIGAAGDNKNPKAKPKGDEAEKT